MQPLLLWVDLSAKRQQFFEDDLGGHPDELNQLCVGLFVGIVPFGIIAGGPGDFGEVADDFAYIAAQGFEIRDGSGTQSIEKSGAP